MHEYMKRLNIALALGAIDAGSFAHAFVAHDDNKKRRCGIYSGKECDCDPEISIKTKEGVVTVLRDGSLRAVQ